MKPFALRLRRAVAVLRGRESTNRMPVPGLAPDSLYAFLDALYQKRTMPGVVLEVGCFMGATTAVAYTFLARQGVVRPYICIDTFDGFVTEQARADERLGMTKRNLTAFACNSLSQVTQNLASWGIQNIQLVKGDICALPDSDIPDRIAVCLLDVDLSVPIHEGMRRIYPKLLPGGIILVDDCTAGTSWVGAIVGYRRFVQEAGLPEQYYMGFGVVEKAGGATPLKWHFSAEPNPETHHFYRAVNPIVVPPNQTQPARFNEAQL